ncbi:NADH-ubiquinone oxidoreductase B18 subunit-domain-containing protein [Glomus cerebriforme]|uniref:NADH dehydrogenase [ubiquinone] 1 beta subcomplex subunit 7 n=1 Tax=Glomus cerebriforme TaxID=658196 RepID=A0A397T6T7_9GLOM|nr:NADH-ubiquinone oxidoreductase B18 subunit-domain-containing protein [Glomus cerebriforme]
MTDGPPEMIATQKEMAEAKLPLGYRDYCAHLLISLNKCRTETWYLPWKCEDEKHSWEKCQYEDYMKRMRLLEKRKKKEEQSKPENNA